MLPTDSFNTYIVEKSVLPDELKLNAKQEAYYTGLEKNLDQLKTNLIEKARK